jgi:hypothetical protein
MGRLSTSGALFLAGLVWATGVHAAPTLKLGPLREVDPSPRKVPLNAREAAVASDGEAWLAVYSQNYVLAATRIQANGLPSGDGFAVGPSDVSVTDPRVASDGVDFFVAWQTLGLDRRIGIQRLTPSGPGPVVDLQISGEWSGYDLSVDDEGVPRVLACDSNHVSSVCSTVELVGDEAIVHPSFDLPFPVLRLRWAFSGGTGLSIVETVEHAVALLEISSDGALLDWRTLEANYVVGDDASPTIVPTPGGGAAAWHRKDGIRVVAISPDGEVTGDQLVASDGSFAWPVLVPTPDDWLLLSSVDSVGCNFCVNVYAQALSPELDTPPDAAVLLAEDVYPRIVASGAGSKTLLVASDSDALGAALVDTAQLVAKPEREPIAFIAPSQAIPIVATAHEGWLIAWSEQEEIRGALVGLDGVPQPFPLALPDSAAVPWALEEGDGGWLMVWAGEGVQVTRLDDTGTVGTEPFSIGNPQQVGVARSSAGWLVVWSRFEGNEHSVIQGEFFDFTGVRQNSMELAEATALPLSFAPPFDVVGAPGGFRVVWSVPYGGISSLELDAAAQPKGAVEKIHEWGGSAIRIAETPEASWLAFSSGSSNYFGPLPFSQAPIGSVNQHWLELRAVGGAAVLGWADQYTGFSGGLSIAAPGEDLQASDVTFPTYGSGFGFALSAAKGSQALLATRSIVRRWGVPQDRLHVGVVSVDETTEGQGGAGGDGVGGSAAGTGGSPDATGAGAGGIGSDDVGAAGGAAGAGNSSTDAGKPAMSGSSSAAGGDSSQSDDEGGAGNASKPRLVAGCGCAFGSEREHTGSVLGMLALSAGLMVRRRGRAEVRR